MLVAVFMGGYLALKSNEALGSVAIGNEYQATSTSNMGTGHIVIGLKDPTAVGAESTVPLSVLGSVIVASSSAVAVTLWDATSTTDTASTTIGTIKASVTEGVYTFDSAIKRGLIVNLPTGDAGSYVITYR